MDWPQVGFWGRMPNVGELLDLLADWVPDPATRRAVLTTNAHRIYGFRTARRLMDGTAYYPQLAEHPFPRTTDRLTQALRWRQADRGAW